MTTHWDPLTEREALGRPLLGSVTLHVSVALLAVGYTWLMTRYQVRLGDPNALAGGAVPINIVRGIPLLPAQSVIENPLASDTRSAVPAAPPETAKAQEKVEEADDAISIPGRTKKAAPKREPDRKFRPYVPERDNQLYASRGPGVNTPTYTGLQPDASTGVGIGTGSGTPFGNLYSWYAEALQRRIGEQWQRELQQVDPRVRVAQRTVVVFDILRDGRLQSIRLTQSCGNPAVDFAAQRAVQNANPVPELPRGLGRSSVSIEVWFQVRR